MYFKYKINESDSNIFFNNALLIKDGNFIQAINIIKQIDNTWGVNYVDNSIYKEYIKEKKFKSKTVKYCYIIYK